jgi:hypothetical protein
MAKPTPQPIPKSDFGMAEPSPASCIPAWVYCPGRSKCLNDPSFNDGNLPSMSADGGANGVWGWSIEYDPSEGLVDDCQIIIGATDCDLNTGTQVGVFQMREDIASFCLTHFGYASSTFAYYHGVCPGNDAGEFLETGECNPSEVSNYAFSPEDFPIYTNDGQLRVSYTVESTDSINSPSWPSSYQLFPMEGKQYLSGYTCVVKV